jgi:YhcH/YjgK/YiaL family protein
MITDTLENAHLYPFGNAWQRAFEFIKSLNEDSPDGEYPLDGDLMFARVLSYETKSPDQARFEAHRKYTDIQSTLDGAEGIGVVNLLKLEEEQAYDEDKDVAFFKTPQSVPTLVDIYPGSFAFLLPHDGHMPALEIGASRRIKKVVVKIAISQLGL